MNTPDTEWEPQVDYILYNLRQSIKHELEGTNIGAYKNDVQKYKTELLNLLTSRDTYWKERVKKRDNEWRDAIKYLINNSDGTQDWFNALRACRSINLPITNEDKLK